ncbi:alpha/beta fold hydrolase [Pseudarthrobacter sp. J1738]
MPAHVEQLFSEVGGLTEFPQGTVVPLLADHFIADWRDVVPMVDVPSWVATGRHSPSFPLEGMQWLADTLPQASLSIFENSGHCPHWNEATEFNRQLLGFLQATRA